MKITVLEFTSMGLKNNDNLVKALRNSIEKELMETKKFKIKQKHSIMPILKREGFQLDDCDTECIIKMGSLIGVGFVISGKIKKFGNHYNLRLMIYDVAARELADKFDVKSNEGLDDLIAHAPTKIIRSLDKEAARIAVEKKAEKEAARIAAEKKAAADEAKGTIDLAIANAKERIAILSNLAGTPLETIIGTLETQMNEYNKTFGQGTPLPMDDVIKELSTLFLEREGQLAAEEAARITAEEKTVKIAAVKKTNDDEANAAIDLAISNAKERISTLADMDDAPLETILGTIKAQMDAYNETLSQGTPLVMDDVVKELSALYLEKTTQLSAKLADEKAAADLAAEQAAEKAKRLVGEEKAAAELAAKQAAEAAAAIGIRSIKIIPEPVKKIRPLYPEIAYDAGIEGRVVVLASIDVKGRVKTAMISEGVPNTGLDESAIKAIMETRFSPAIDDNGQKVPVWMKIPINFKIN